MKPWVKPVLSSVCICLFFLTVTVDAQVVRNQLPLTTKTSVLANRSYSSALDAIKSGNLEDAIAKIEMLGSQHAGTLISVGDRHQVEATLLADQMMHMIGFREGSRLLDQPDQFDGFERWRSLLRGGLSRESLMDEGDRFWQMGEVQSAKQCWRLAFNDLQLNDPDRSNGTRNFLLNLTKRLIVSELLSGHFRRGTKLIDDLRKKYPESVGKVAGQEGVIHEILASYSSKLQSSGREEFLNLDARLPFERVRYSLSRREWSVPVSTALPAAKLIDPLMWDDVLILQDASGVRALNVQTGKPAWPIGPEDAGFIFETKITGAQNELPMGSQGGIIDGNVWYGRTGVATFVDAQLIEPSAESRIVALGLNSEGRLEWTRTTNDMSGNETSRARVFSGSPVAHRGKIFLPMRSQAPFNQLQIVCLNPEDGEEIWLRDIAASLLPITGDETLNDQLKLEGGNLFWLIEGLALCCLDARDGQVLWISAIDPVETVLKQVGNSKGDFVISGDSVLCTSQNGVASFDKFTGKLNWEHHLKTQPLSCLGVCDGLLIVEHPGLYAFDIQTGTMIWSHQSNSFDRRISRPSLNGRSIFYPYRNQLFTIDAFTGRILQQDRFPWYTENHIKAIKIVNSRMLMQTEENFESIQVFMK